MTPILLAALLLSAPPRDIVANNAFFYCADVNPRLLRALDVDETNVVERQGSKRQTNLLYQIPARIVAVPHSTRRLR